MLQRIGKEIGQSTPACRTAEIILRKTMYCCSIDPNKLPITILKAFEGAELQGLIDSGALVNSFTQTLWRSTNYQKLSLQSLEGLKLSREKQQV